MQDPTIAVFRLIILIMESLFESYSFHRFTLCFQNILSRLSRSIAFPTASADGSLDARAGGGDLLQPCEEQELKLFLLFFLIFPSKLIPNFRRFSVGCVKIVFWNIVFWNKIIPLGLCSCYFWVKVRPHQLFVCGTKSKTHREHCSHCCYRSWFLMQNSALLCRTVGIESVRIVCIYIFSKSVTKSKSVKSFF